MTTGSCSQCGAPAAQVDARFCAQCGAPLGAAAAGPAAAGPAHPETHLLTPPPEFGEPELLAGPPPRRRRATALTAGVVTVLGVAGVVTALVIRNDGSTPGAASPEAAVARAAAAITRQDVDGVLDLVDPAEARPLRALVGATRRSLAQDDLVTATGIPEPWLHLRAADLRVTADRRSGSVAFVTATAGSLQADVDQRGLPDQLRPVTPRTARVATAAGDLTVAGRPPVVAVVRVGDGWFLSPTTTVLETVRRVRDLPSASFGPTGDLDRGAKDPGSVLTDLAAAVQARDARAGTSLVSQRELPALSAYYAVFAGALGGVAAQLPGQAGPVETSTQPMSDDLVKVFVENASFRNGSGPLRYGGGCLTTSNGGDRHCLDSAVTRETGLTKPFVVVAHEREGWRIQPVATVLEYLRTVMADGSRNAVYLYLGIPQAAPVTATLRLGDSRRLRMNDAGFAHVRLRAPAGTCFHTAGELENRFFAAWNAESVFVDAADTDCYVVPAGGVVDGVVWSARGPSAVVPLSLNAVPR